jgi:hypothetical protein
VAVLGLTLLLQAVFGAADPVQRFSPVPMPMNAPDPCGDRGPAGRWVKMSATNAPPSIHRQGWLDSATVWTGGRMVVALRKGGKWNGNAFDPCANAWAPIAETQELAREQPWQIEQRDRPFVASHVHGSDDGWEKILVWDSAAKKYVTVTAATPLASRGHYAVALVGRKLLVWGGWGHTLRTLGDGAVLDIARKSWRKMSAAGAPSPRLEPVVAWTGSRLVVWGGRFASSPATPVTVLADGAQYDPAADRWKPMSQVDAPSPRVEPVMAWTGRKLVVVGGSAQLGGTPLRDGAIYDPATDRWTHVDPLPGDVVLPKANVGPLTRILVAPDGRVVFLPDKLTQVVILDPLSARWTTVDADEPGKRNSYRAFLAGRRLIVWGGAQLIAEHLCGPHIEGLPQCDPWAEIAPRDDGWMILLPRQ